MEYCIHFINPGMRYGCDALTNGERVLVEFYDADYTKLKLSEEQMSQVSTQIDQWLAED